MRSSTTPRALALLTTVFALTVGLASAQAHDGIPGRHGGGAGTVPSFVRGVVVSSDAPSATIVVTPATTRSSSRQGDPAAPASVTITTDADTLLRRNGATATVGDFTAGTVIVARLDAKGATTLADALAKPALAVVGFTPLRHYGFAGTVTAVDAAAGTVAVDVARSGPAGAFGAGSAPVTFTVGDHTLVRAGHPHSSLADVAVGDAVVGELLAPAGLGATELVANPLSVLIDVPAAHHTRRHRHRHR